MLLTCPTRIFSLEPSKSNLREVRREFNSSRRTPLRTFQAESARSNRAASSRLRATWMRCPRFPAVSIGTEKSKLNKYGLGMPGATLRLGLGRAPAVTIAACDSVTRARAASSAGLKYKAARERLAESQAFGGHGVTA